MDLADGYTRLAEHARRHAAALDGRCDHVQLLADAIALATEFTDVMRPDPLLPPELLPQPWPGTDARARVARYFADLSQHHTDATPIRLFQRYGSLSPTTAGDRGVPDRVAQRAFFLTHISTKVSLRSSE